jgi:hypothetical protein
VRGWRCLRVIDLRDRCIARALSIVAKLSSSSRILLDARARKTPDVNENGGMDGDVKI